ncbi:MAG: bifunctional glutamate N-acetyltransferase/amino-acid acetyltransferase ArgJ [Bacteroidota bacterium]|nr:bifunctional glutamate N-acetyltransferase/amino-acid acetyltransferase ArgJ [Bacteroidota bacterium]MDP4231749.1 bifunctional glutamate N-acetyltransferase/amino-acid acetyltransferase ArgJ [Bacteroidota bacterium]MDP4243485.1 bifunctional glutamate N-acetyltransferase/amino-acid acetyltransferase ArgJ [Bacteroidota bacterium]MDP4289257.1 bifunctional glutamate N-acetyltransferase/amino-acid acetyltransferase ArgJ [Bacteroidota bacterium]
MSTSTFSGGEIPAATLNGHAPLAEVEILTSGEGWIEDPASNEHIHEVDGGITAPLGFSASGVYCGIRKVKKDIALIKSESPADVAAVFTLNKTIAAPLVVDKELLARGGRKCSAIVVNSGNANACTGDRGMQDAWRMVEVTASALNIPQEEVLISSTGVIGQYLPIDNVVQGIQQLPPQLSDFGSNDAAVAIMTTDTYSKEIAVEFEIHGKPVCIGGIAKGSGMIAPNMATMLAFITTDASVPQPLLQRTFSRLIDRSFNRISVDGDMSTNDMALMLANGMSGVAIVQGPEFEMFESALEHVLTKLAKMIARDGEGATKLVEIVVRGAHTEKEAVTAAQSVANSNLVKTAIHGADANWGRILAAVGYSGIDFDPANVELFFGTLPVLGQNYNIVIDEVKAKEIFSQENITITIDLHQGDAEANFWTCDLSKEYVHINASYRS